MCMNIVCYIDATAYSLLQNSANILKQHCGILDSFLAFTQGANKNWKFEQRIKLFLKTFCAVVFKLENLFVIISVSVFHQVPTE